jgi:hypothetical protein
VTGTNSVRVAGVTGLHAASVNGLYELTSERSAEGTMTMYRKVGDGDTWLEYHAPSKWQWQVKPGSGKGRDMAWACCAVPAKCLPEKCPEGQWQVYNGGKREAQPAVTIVGLSAAELAREAARLANATHSVRIAGVTGDRAAIVNGVYEPTPERSADGTVTVYRKVGDANRWLEYHAPREQWQVKHEKGTASSWAYCAVPAKCLPGECPAGKWQVPNAGGQFEAQPVVTVATGL